MYHALYPKGLIKGMFVGWNPTKEEIEGWLIVHELEFAHKDNRSSRFNPI
jgi:hypothetical protein